MLMMMVFNFLGAVVGSGGWTIYGNSDKPGVEEESLTPFLEVHLVRDTPQAVGARVERPQPGSEHEQFYDPNAN